MKPLARMLICGGCLAAGVALSALLAPAASPGPAAAREGGASSTRPSGAAAVGEGEADRQRLQQLSRDPFIELSDEEIAALAGRLDLRREGNIRLLNSILHPGLRSRIWEACLRANVDKFSLPELFQLASGVRLTREAGTTFDSIFGRVAAEGGQDAFFPGGALGSSLLLTYIDYCSRSNSSFSGALRRLPIHGIFSREQLLQAWVKNHPGASGVREILQLSPAEGGSAGMVDRVIPQAWSGTPVEGRQSFLDELESLNPSRRNELLRIMAEEVPRDDPDQMVQILGRMTSFAMQRKAVLRFIRAGRYNLVYDTIAEPLIERIDGMPDAARYAKVRELVEKWLEESKPTRGD